jgi:DNA-binding transcriptional regulator YiaG
MPEVALRCRHAMASCCRREYIARTPSIDRAQAEGVCVASAGAARDVRTWDSGRRAVPPRVVAKAKRVVADRPRQTELLSLDVLARELGVHERTSRAAARSGRLVVEFSSRSAFGRPIRLATRAAAAEFMRRYYRQCYSRHCARPTPPDISVPSNYDRQLRRVRRELRLTQSAFAERIGAAGKGVVYQWETRKRRPSPVFWQRIQDLNCSVPILTDPLIDKTSESRRGHHGISCHVLRNNR